MQDYFNEIKENFIKDVEEHKLKIIKDDGVYRHLLFKNQKRGAYWTEIITSPNLLTINGDMGTYVFSRLNDMFEFFRNDELKINYHYWTEKLKVNRESYKYFDIELYKENIIKYIEEYFEESIDNVDKEFYNDYLKNIIEAEDEIDAMNKIREFYIYSEDVILKKLPDSYKYFNFDDFKEDWGNCYRPDYRYVWNLFCIVKIIQEYEKIKEF